MNNCSSLQNVDDDNNSNNQINIFKQCSKIDTLYETLEGFNWTILQATN